VRFVKLKLCNNISFLKNKVKFFSHYALSLIIYNTSIQTIIHQEKNKAGNNLL